MAAPSQLHRALELVKDASAEERKHVLRKALGAKNLAVIRRIPELLSPLSDEEKEMVAEWAEGTAGGEDVSDRDFAFHLMANCRVPIQRILQILERNRTFSRNALDHIQKVLDVGEWAAQLDSYLCEVAETLLKSEDIRSRDRGRHMLMTLARDETDWCILTERFSVEEIADLRQRVIERFLNECPRNDDLLSFINNLVAMCYGCIDSATQEDVHKEASHMHWVLMCLELLEEKEQHFRSFASKLASKFWLRTLPYSVRWKLESVLVKLVDKPVGWMPIVKKTPVETNAQVAARLGISKRQAAKMRASGELS